MPKKRYKADHRADTRGGAWAGIPHCVMESEAYRHLSPLERAILGEIVLRFKGFNNGKIAISYKELAYRLNRKNEVPFAPAIATLMQHGLIDIGEDAVWHLRKARAYRLTFVNTTDAIGRPIPATNEYLHWRPPEKNSAINAGAGEASAATDVEAGTKKPATARIVDWRLAREARSNALLRMR